MSNNELIIIPKIEKYTKFKIYQPKERIINELDQNANIIIDIWMIWLYYARIKKKLKIY